ncbi:hypothetical protein Barb7_02364 [Bacteroidales bacterium Barb7]|nr:hypothetical protein Barb7_02364 [Bacteroidales bacterium Barb7]
MAYMQWTFPLYESGRMDLDVHVLCSVSNTHITPKLSTM